VPTAKARIVLVGTLCFAHPTTAVGVRCGVPRRYAGQCRQIEASIEPPFDRHVGDQPALSEQEMDDIIALLRTSNDGCRGETP